MTVGVGVDSTTVNSGRAFGNQNLASRTLTLSYYSGHPGIGRHFLAWLERNSGGTGTWAGDATVPNNFQSGIWGSGMA